MRSRNQSASQLFKSHPFKKTLHIQMALRMDLGISSFYMENVFSKAVSMEWKSMALSYKYNNKAGLKGLVCLVFVGN